MNETTNYKGFTAQGQHHLPPTDLAGKIPCQLTGPGIYNSTTIYVRPERLPAVEKKYADRGQRLTHSLTSAAPAQPVPPPVAPTPPAPKAKLPTRITSSKYYKPLISLNTGRIWPGPKQAAEELNISLKGLGEHLRGRCKQVTGLRFRYATDQEREQYENDPDWTYTGELLPVLKKGKHVSA